MNTSRTIEKILEEYFEFCLELLQKIPAEIEKSELAERAFSLRNQLKCSIDDNVNDNNPEIIKTVEEDIFKIRIALQKKEK